jgi:hypothetical protein
LALGESLINASQNEELLLKMFVVCIHFVHGAGDCSDDQCYTEVTKDECQEGMTPEILDGRFKIAHVPCGQDEQNTSNKHTQS